MRFIPLNSLQLSSSRKFGKHTCYGKLYTPFSFLFFFLVHHVKPLQTQEAFIHWQREQGFFWSLGWLSLQGAWVSAGSKLSPWPVPFTFFPGVFWSWSQFILAHEREEPVTCCQLSLPPDTRDSPVLSEQSREIETLEGSEPCCLFPSLQTRNI